MKLHILDIHTADGRIKTVGTEQWASAYGMVLYQVHALGCHVR